jgi:hypothetical protein
MTKTMNDMNGHGSIYGTVLTVFLYLLTVFNIQQWAAIATIFAGVATGAFTIYKWIRLYKLDKTKSDDGDTTKNIEE